MFALGIVKSDLKPYNSFIQHGIGYGFYVINAKNWNNKRFNKYWLEIDNRYGIVPLLGYELKIDLLKIDDFKISNNNLATIGGLISFGLSISKEF